MKFLVIKNSQGGACGGNHLKWSFTTIFSMEIFNDFISSRCPKNFFKLATGLTQDPNLTCIDLHNKIFKTSPLDTKHKLSVNKTFRTRTEHLLNVLCTFNLHPVPKKWWHMKKLQTFNFCRVSTDK